MHVNVGGGDQGHVSPTLRNTHRNVEETHSVGSPAEPPTEASLPALIRTSGAQNWDHLADGPLQPIRMSEATDPIWACGARTTCDTQGGFKG